MTRQPEPPPPRPRKIPSRSPWFLLFGALASFGALARLEPSASSILVFDLRVFEVRLPSPDLSRMSRLPWRFPTDGTDFTPGRWLAALGSRIADAWVGALATETLEARDGSARWQWTQGSRAFEIAVAAGPGESSALSEVTVGFRRTKDGATVAEGSTTLPIELGETVVWSGASLEMSGTEYLSLFREHSDVTERGQVYQALRRYSIFLALAITARSSATPLPQPPPIEGPPAGYAVPEIDTPFGIPLSGHIRVSFEVGPTGAPEKLRLLRSTVPEANPRILGDVLEWRYPSPGPRSVEISIR
jgi:hypothetical protein